MKISTLFAWNKNPRKNYRNALEAYAARLDADVLDADVLALLEAKSKVAPVEEKDLLPKDLLVHLEKGNRVSEMLEIVPTPSLPGSLVYFDVAQQQSAPTYLAAQQAMNQVGGAQRSVSSFWIGSGLPISGGLL